MTLKPHIEDGRQLVGRLERYSHTKLADIPPAERLAHAEVFAWFSAARSLIAEASGDHSKQIDRWDELQKELSSEEREQRKVRESGANDDAALYIKRLHPSMGLLTEFEQHMQAHSTDNAVADKIIRNNPWISGLFYLFAFISILVTIRVVFGQLSVWLIPATVFGSLLGVTVIGAFQLRNDGRVKEKSFVTLIALSFRSMPLIGRLMPHHNATNTPEA